MPDRGAENPRSAPCGKCIGRIYQMATIPATISPSHNLTLPEALDAAVAATLAEALVKCRGEDVLIDASFVRRAGAHCLQVLRTAETAWKADKRLLTWVNVPARLIDELRNFAREPEFD